MTVATWIWIGLFVVGVVEFYCYARTGHFLKCMGFTAVTGSATLGLVWALGHLITFALAVTPLSIGVSLLLGIPGVAGMLLLQLI